MIVVSDASPLNILVRIGCVDVLPPLFGEVYVAPRVVGELMHAATPGAVRAWIMAPPIWLHCRAPSTLLDTTSRGAGEREAISLAVELKAALLLIDDRKARQDARRFGVPITGTLGVLELAAARSLVSLPDVVARLRTTDFRLSDELLDAALRRDQQRRQG